MPEKRKTRTSSEVKRRYNNKVYAQVAASLPKDIVAAFKEKCARENVSQASILLAAIKEYLEN